MKTAQIAIRSSAKLSLKKMPIISNSKNYIWLAEVVGLWLLVVGIIVSGCRFV